MIEEVEERTLHPSLPPSLPPLPATPTHLSRMAVREAAEEDAYSSRQRRGRGVEGLL